MPGRTVASCTGDVLVMAATSWPPKAGFQDSSRPPSTSTSTASPVNPAPRRAASRAATSRPHSVPGASTAQGRASAAHAAGRPCQILLDRPAFDHHQLRRPPRTRPWRRSTAPFGRDCGHLPADGLSQPGGGAQQLAGHPGAARLEQHRDHLFSPCPRRGPRLSSRALVGTGRPVQRPGVGAAVTPLAPPGREGRRPAPALARHLQVPGPRRRTSGCPPDPTDRDRVRRRACAAVAPGRPQPARRVDLGRLAQPLGGGEHARAGRPRRRPSRRRAPGGRRPCPTSRSWP